MLASSSSPIPAWYKSFHPHLYAMALKLGYRREETEDLLNQFFLDLLEKEKDFSTVENPQAYLSIAFRRKLIDYNRSPKRKLFVVTDSLPEHQQEPSVTELVEQMQSNRELVNQVKKAYLKLPERCRKVIYLKFYEGLNTEQIANRTGLSNRSVYNNLFEGIKMLRVEMGRLAPGMSYAALLSILPLVITFS